MSSVLCGKRILVTRPKNHGGRLVQRLQEVGAVPILLPLTEVAAPTDPGPFHRALAKLSEFDWLILTSVNGVQAVAERLRETGDSLARYMSLRIAVVGPSTGEALGELGRKADLMPERFVAEEIAAALPVSSGTRVLLARGNLARPELPRDLATRGAVVLDVVAYRLVGAADAPELQSMEMPDAITLMSGESARMTIEKLRETGLEEWLIRSPIACIGPVTAATVVEANVKPTIVAGVHTIDGLVRSLEQIFCGERFLA